MRNLTMGEHQIFEDCACDTCVAGRELKAENKRLRKQNSNQLLIVVTTRAERDELRAEVSL